MPKHTSVDKQKTFFITTVTRAAAVALFISIAYGTANEAESRKPAAISKQDHIKDSLHKHKVLHTSKLVPNIQMSIEKDNDFLSALTGEIRLKATAVSSSPMPKLSLNWVVPDSIKIIDGETDYEFTDVNAGFQKVVYLTIKPTNETNEHVRLKATGYNGSYLYSINTIYNTLDQDHINKRAKGLVKKNEEFLEKQKLNRDNF